MAENVPLKLNCAGGGVSSMWQVAQVSSMQECGARADRDEADIPPHQHVGLVAGRGAAALDRALVGGEFVIGVPARLPWMGTCFV